MAGVEDHAVWNFVGLGIHKFLDAGSVFYLAVVATGGVAYGFLGVGPAFGKGELQVGTGYGASLVFADTIPACRSLSPHP